MSCGDLNVLGGEISGSWAGALLVCEPGSKPRRLLDEVRRAIRVRHLSANTERMYIRWIRRFVLFHGRRSPSGLGVEVARRFPAAPREWAWRWAFPDLEKEFEA